VAEREGFGPWVSLGQPSGVRAKTIVPIAGDRGFESRSLQRGVWRDELVVKAVDGVGTAPTGETGRAIGIGDVACRIGSNLAGDYEGPRGPSARSHSKSRSASPDAKIGAPRYHSRAVGTRRNAFRSILDSSRGGFFPYGPQKNSHVGGKILLHAFLSFQRPCASPLFRRSSVLRCVQMVRERLLQARQRDPQRVDRMNRPSATVHYCCLPEDLHFRRLQRHLNRPQRPGAGGAVYLLD
jgi:hypothetical protein